VEKKIKFKKDEEEDLPFADGGFKFLKRWKLMEKQNSLTEFDFKVIDDPEFEGDGIELLATDSGYFEDKAFYKWSGKNFSAMTTRKTEEQGYFEATFENVDTGRKCTVDGLSDKTGCRIKEENTKFEILFAGSTGFSQTTTHCLHASDGTSATYNTIDVQTIDGGKKYGFNGIPYVLEEYIGFNVGTYVFDNTCTDCAAHPFLIDPLLINNTDVIKEINCTEWKDGSFTGSGNIAGTSPTQGCVGIYTIEVLEPFNIHKYWCTAHGFMGGEGAAGEGRVIFDDTCAQVTVATEEDDGMSTGALVGIILGSIVGASLVGFGLYYFFMRDPIVNKGIMFSNA